MEFFHCRVGLMLGAEINADQPVLLRVKDSFLGFANCFNYQIAMSKGIVAIRATCYSSEFTFALLRGILQYVLY